VWVDSIDGTIFKFWTLFSKFPLNYLSQNESLFLKWLWTRTYIVDPNFDPARDVPYFVNGVPDKNYAARGYEKWIEQVKRDIPAENLLVHNARQGWSPLCKFLGVAECPSVSYPRSNERVEIGRVVVFIQAVVYGWPLMLGLLAFGVQRCCCQGEKKKQKQG
jgi:hypothetical protein